MVDTLRILRGTPFKAIVKCTLSASMQRNVVASRLSFGPFGAAGIPRWLHATCDTSSNFLDRRVSLKPSTAA